MFINAKYLLEQEVRDLFGNYYKKAAPNSPSILLSFSLIEN